MTPTLDVLSSSEWDVLADVSHKVIFGKSRPPEHNRIDFALLAVNAETSDPLGYVTVRELDHESVYWQFGGAVPEIRGTLLPARFYQLMLGWTRDRYKRITTYVAADNIAYLRFAMGHGFRIIGTRTTDGDVFVELLLDFERVKKDAL